MKARITGALVALIVLCAFALGGCATSGTLHKPTTAGNAGTSALVAYAAGGFFAGQYLGLDPCATPPVYPCKTKAVNDQVLHADKVAYAAAKAADAAAGDAAAKAKADDALKALKKLGESPPVKSQVDLINAKNGESQ